MAWSHASRAACAAAIGASLLLGAAPASAFCRSTTCTGDCPRDPVTECKLTGLDLYWPGMCVGFSLQKDGTVNIPMEEVRPAIRASFVAWSDLDCGSGTATIAFSELDEVSCHASEYNEDGGNANIVLFQDTKWNYKGVDNTLAKTTVTFDNETGEIYDADIEINHAFNFFTVSDTDVQYDLQSVVTHEVGHLIGLDHTTDDFDATMFAAYDKGSIELRTLEPDDIAAACAVYPPDRSAACEPTPLRGLADECASTEEATDSGAGCSVANGGLRPPNPRAHGGLRPPNPRAHGRLRPPSPREGRDQGISASFLLIIGAGAAAVLRARRFPGRPRS